MGEGDRLLLGNCFFRVRLVEPCRPGLEGVVDGYVIVVSMNGRAACYEAETGERLWEEKLGVKGQFAASPLVVDGHVMIQNVYGGATVVIKPGPKLEIVGINELGAEVDEVFRATLAPIRGRIFSRSLSTLYCVGR